MKKTENTFFIFALLISFHFLASPAYSQEKSKKLWPDTIKIGGELRFRHESQFNYDFNEATDLRTDHLYYLRTRVYLDLNPSEFFRAYAMFQDSEIFGEESALIQTKARHKFYQGFVEFKGNGLPLKSKLRIGRQELVYGDQRLIGSFGWSNQGRSFDGAVLRLENQKFWLDLLGVRIHPNTNEYQLAAAYAHINKVLGGDLEPYFLYLHSSHGGLSSGELSVFTFGTRLSSKFLKNFDATLEAAYQTGESNHNTIQAFATHSKVGYTFPLSWKPRVGLEYNFASGDDAPTSGTVKTFNNIFPTNHDKYGLIDFFGWRNLHDFRIALSAQPHKTLKASLDYHAFLLPEAANGVITATGSTLRARNASASSFAGQEIDFLIKYEPLKYLEAVAGYSVFLPGSFFQDTGSSDRAHFFYTQLTTRY